MITRWHVGFALAIVVFIGSLVAALATMEQRSYQLRGYVDPIRDSALPYRIPRFGVNVDLRQYERNELYRQLDLMDELGVRWVRQFFYWDEIEPAPGEYDWDVWDEIVAAVDQYPDIEIVAVLISSPSWAVNANTDYLYPRTAPPDSPEDFADFSYAFASRYQHTITHYQIWDEPNIELGWGGVSPRPAQYAALLQAAYAGIKQANRRAVVLAGALAPTIETGPQNISDIRYLRDLYAYGAADFTDGFAGKPYGYSESPLNREIDHDHLNFSRFILLREVMEENDDHHKPLWASAWGWNSLPDDWAGHASVWGSVTEIEQIDYTLEALERAEREWPWLGGMVLQHWQTDAEADDAIWGFSLIALDGNLGTLYNALVEQTFVNAASNGIYSPRNSYARYSGIWAFSDFGADIGWVQDSRLEFDFAGRDVALLLRKDDYVSYLYVEIDDQPANALPRDVSGNAYIVLRSGTRLPELTTVVLARGLPTTQVQTLRVITDELIPDEPNNRWPLVGFAISDGDLSRPYDRQITIAWWTTFFAGLAVIISGMKAGWEPLRRLFNRLAVRLDGVYGLIIGFVSSIALMISLFLTWNDGVPAVFKREFVQLGLSIATIGLIYLANWNVMLVGLSVGLLFIIIYNRLELGILLTLFWAPFFLFPVELYRFAFPMVEIVLWITVFAAVLRWLAALGWRRQSKVSQFQSSFMNSFVDKLHPLDYLMVAWVVLGLVSLTWAEQRTLAITEFRTMILQPVLFYVVFRALPHFSVLRRLIMALVTAGAVVALVGIVMWFGGEGIITAEGGARRLVSVYGSPNNVALVLGRCIPFVLAVILLTRGRLRIGALVILIILAGALMLTQSAGALFIGVPVAVIGVLLLSLRRRVFIPIVALGLIGIIVFGFALQSPRFSRMLDFNEGTNFYRLRVWQSSLNLMADYPITGVGLDQFLYKFRGVYIMPDAWEEPDLSHPHNILLDFWVRLGLLGVVWLMWTQVVFWKAMTRVYSRLWKGASKYPLELAIAIGLMGSMLNLISHGLVDNSVFVLDLAYIFAFILGAAAILSNMGAIDEKPDTMV